MMGVFVSWCRGWDLNPHGVTRLILSQVRLPFRHSGMNCSERYLLYHNLHARQAPF